MNSKIKGTICGVFAAISYGMNPLGALNLYQEGLNVNSVIFYRYGLATTILALIMLAQKKSFAITRREFAVLSVLGVLMVVSSLTLFGSFNFMDAGIASTLLFVYPVMVAVMMAIFFKEKVTPITVISIALALGGISLLYKGGRRCHAVYCRCVARYGIIVDLCRVYHRGEQVGIDNVVGEAHFLCIADRHGVAPCLFVYGRRYKDSAAYYSDDVGVCHGAGGVPYHNIADTDGYRRS